MTVLISLLLPTRGRPELARRFLQSVAVESAHPEDVEVILYADEDDVASHTIDYEGVRLTRIVGPRQTMGAYNSDCLAQSNGQIVVLANDDMVIRSHGWDNRIRNLDASIKDKIYLGYGNDLLKKGALCTFPILSRRTCELLRQPFHRAYRGAFIDYHLMDMFKRLEQIGYRRIFYMDDVIFEHLHYRKRKALKDSTYMERGRFDDDMTFIGLAAMRQASAEDLASEIAGNQPKMAWPVNPPRTYPSIWETVHLFASGILFDNRIPRRWRLFLTWWFGARLVARNLPYLR